MRSKARKYLHCRQQRIAITGALCCVAAGPQRRPHSRDGDISLGHEELHWRTNSSFSPRPLRIWDCRLQSGGLQHASNGTLLHGSPSISNIEGSRERVADSDRFTNHEHSVSDGTFSHAGSPLGDCQALQCTSPVQKFNFGESCSSSTEGSSYKTSRLPGSTKRRSAIKATESAQISECRSPLSESRHWESTSGQPVSCSGHSLLNQHSLMPKLVYPLVFCNPMSDCENFDNADISSLDRMTDGEGHVSSSNWHDDISSIEHKFQNTPNELQRLETSPEPSASSRREGLRWSSASSSDIRLDGETFDVAERMDLDSQRTTIDIASNQKCVLCGKLLWQKSPWSSHRIMRGDFPIAGVLSCSHVFHAECLEQMTPENQIREPPCPLCLKTITPKAEGPSVPVSLQTALRSLRRGRGVTTSDEQGNCSNKKSNNNKGKSLGNWFWTSPQRKSSNSKRNHFRKHFTFKGNVRKAFLGSKVFRRDHLSTNSTTPTHNRI